MDQLLDLLLSALFGVMVISAVWVALIQRYRGQVRLLVVQHDMARRELDEHELRSVELLSLAHRHLPLGRRPELAREALPELDRAMQESRAELKQLHRRLVVNLHVINQLRKSEEQMSARVIELEQILMESSEYELRARFRAVSSERDYFRNQLIELQQMVAPGESAMVTRLTTLNKHNEVLRGELRQNRRLVMVMERQIRLLQREGMESAGIALTGLMQHDLPPGAFESLSDVPLDDPEQFTDADIEDPSSPPTLQLALGLPVPIAPTAPDEEEPSQPGV